MEKEKVLLKLESIRDKSRIFNPMHEAFLLFDEARKSGFVLKDFFDSEKANMVFNYLDPMLAYSLEESQNYGVLVVGNTKINVYSYWNPISEEEENKILERKKREIWNKHSKKQPAWYRKHKDNQNRLKYHK